MNYFYMYNTKIGKLVFVSEDEYIVEILLEKDITEENIKRINTTHVEKENKIIKKAIKQINEYLQGDRKEFDIPIKPKGTEFRKKVWNKLIDIPYGKTTSYKDIAVKLDNHNASRAVGNANNKNPIPIIIPCHRVIGTNGKLVGYSGGIEVKKYLLDIEKKNDR